MVMAIENRLVKQKLRVEAAVLLYVIVCNYCTER